MNNTDASALYVGDSTVKQVNQGSQMVLAPNGDQLWYKANERPSLDLRFASKKSLKDQVSNTNKVTHTRASSATYVDGDGIIQTAVTNYLEDSEGFNASSDWNKGPLAGTATDNAATAPDGSTTATLLVENTATNGRYIANVHSFVANRTYTISCWAKQYSNTGTQDRYLGFLLNKASFSSEHQRAVFNLTDGSFTVTGVQSTTASIEAYPDGWYRCSLTAIATTSSTVGIQFRLTDNTNQASSSWTGDGVSGIYIWGAQLEESSTLGEYVKTTGIANSAPRFDHDPVTGESLGLLIEDARTNLVRYSVANIGNGWINSSGQAPVNLSLNKLGVFSGVRAISNGQSWQGIRLDNSVTLPSLVAGTTYTITDWWMVGDVNPSNKFRSTMKLNGINSTCAVEKTNSSSDPLDANSYSIVNVASHGTISNIQVEDAGSNVFKLSYNFVPISSGAHLHTVSPRSFTPGESVIVLGAQVEEGVNPSSYIPTSGSTVTRASDNVSITGTNFSSWYNTTDQKGTIYFEGIVRAFSGQHQDYYSINDGSTINEIRLFKNKLSNKEQFKIQTSGTVQLSQANDDLSYGQNKKAALAFELDNSINAFDGTANNVDTNIDIPVVDQVDFGGAGPATGSPFITLKRFTYWPVRVSNDTVTRLTE